MNVLQGLTLHHIGVVTRGIEKELPYFHMLGYSEASAIFTETGQKVRGLFIEAPGQPRLELLENLTDDGPLAGPLAKGIKFYHFAYSVADVDATLDHILAYSRAKVIVPPVDAEFFKRVAFVMLPNMMLVEFVELFRAYDGLSRAESGLSGDKNQGKGHG